jgi:hypothetical protein
MVTVSMYATCILRPTNAHFKHTIGLLTSQFLIELYNKTVYNIQLYNRVDVRVKTGFVSEDSCVCTH